MSSKAIRVTLKLPPQPKPKEPDTFPCCLCPSMSRDGLLRVQDPPVWWYDPDNADAAKDPCMAHAECANVVPETWVDEVEVGEPNFEGLRRREKAVFGVDGIVKDRWNLVSATECRCTALLIVGGHAEMHGVYEAQEQNTWSAGSVHEGQVSEGLPCVVRARWAREWDCVSGASGDREGGCAIG